MQKKKNIASPSTTQHHDTPNNKTHFIKFRVTEIEKRELEHTAKLLNLALSTLIRRALHNVKIEKKIIAASNGEETLTAVSTLLETVKDILRKQISSVLYRATSFEEFSDRLIPQYGITVKESRGCLSYLPSGRTKFIRAKHLGDNFDKAAVFATLNANAERKPKVQFKQDAIGKLIDIQAKLAEGKGIGYERWAKKFNLKAMAQTLLLLQEKGLTDEDALNQRIEELRAIVRLG